MESNGEDFGAKTVYKGGIEVKDSTYREFFDALKKEETNRVTKEPAPPSERVDEGSHFEEIEISGIQGVTDESLERGDPALVVSKNEERLKKLRGAISKNGDKNQAPASGSSLKGPIYQRGYIGDSSKLKTAGIFEKIRNLFQK